MTSAEQGYDVILGVLETYEVNSPMTIADSILELLDDNDLMIVGSNEKKLVPAQVRAIRSKHKLGDSQAELADYYGVNPATISRIVRGEYW